MVAVLLLLSLLMHTYVGVQSQENYNGTYDMDEDRPCFSVNLRLSATIYYQQDDGNISSVHVVGNDFTNPFQHATCDIGSDVGSASINISWPSTDPHYFLSILFAADFQVGWYVERMKFVVNAADAAEFDDPSEGFFELHNDKDLTVDNITLTKSYQCDSNVTHSFSSSASNSSAVLTTTALHLQAFQFNNVNGDFGPTDMQCVEDVDDSKTLPIIVGTVITVVLLVALMLYIIARVVKHRRDSKQSLLT